MMSDKDLYVVIAEMLQKQDQQSEILERIDSTLNEFMHVTVKQFDQQLKFNEGFLNTQDKMSHLLGKISDRLDNIEQKLA